MTCRPSFTALQTLLLGDPLPSSLTPKRQRKLTEDQVEWHGGWKGQVAVAKSVDEAFAAVGGVIK